MAYVAGRTREKVGTLRRECADAALVQPPFTSVLFI
jgi:hypothetical protein